jgi:hypothetical protein
MACSVENFIKTSLFMDYYAVLSAILTSLLMPSLLRHFKLAIIGFKRQFHINFFF